MLALPAPDVAAVFWIDSVGERHGPDPLAWVVTQVGAGTLPDDTPVWWQGVDDWALFSSYPELTAAAMATRPTVTAVAAAPEVPSLFARDLSPSLLAPDPAEEPWTGPMPVVEQAATGTAPSLFGRSVPPSRDDEPGIDPVASAPEASAQETFDVGGGDGVAYRVHLVDPFEGNDPRDDVNTVETASVESTPFVEIEAPVVQAAQPITAQPITAQPFDEPPVALPVEAIGPTSTEYSLPEGATVVPTTGIAPPAEDVVAGPIDLSETAHGLRLGDAAALDTTYRSLVDRAAAFVDERARVAQLDRDLLGLTEMAIAAMGFEITYQESGEEYHSFRLRTPDGSNASMAIARVPLAPTVADALSRPVRCFVDLDGRVSADLFPADYLAADRAHAEGISAAAGMLGHHLAAITSTAIHSVELG
ncbi:MAG: hypothetical protein R2698_10155 [Microthrixaceae bacterium]